MQLRRSDTPELDAGVLHDILLLLFSETAILHSQLCTLTPNKTLCDFPRRHLNQLKYQEKAAIGLARSLTYIN